MYAGKKGSKHVVVIIFLKNHISYLLHPSGQGRSFPRDRVRKTRLFHIFPVSTHQQALPLFFILCLLSGVSSLLHMASLCEEDVPPSARLILFGACWLSSTVELKPRPVQIAHQKALYVSPRSEIWCFCEVTLSLIISLSNKRIPNQMYLRHML